MSGISKAAVRNRGGTAAPRLFLVADKDSAWGRSHIKNSEFKKSSDVLLVGSTKHECKHQQASSRL